MIKKFIVRLLLSWAEKLSGKKYCECVPVDSIKPQPYVPPVVYPDDNHGDGGGGGA